MYYGGVYISRNTALDTNHSCISRVPNSQNRSMQEITAGWTHTLWRDGKYGALQYMVQYAYFLRNPWYVAPGTLKSAHQSAVWSNLRYVSPRQCPNDQLLGKEDLASLPGCIENKLEVGTDEDGTIVWVGTNQWLEIDPMDVSITVQPAEKRIDIPCPGT